MTEHVTSEANVPSDNITPLTRFRPTDTLDFSRRAKNLSKLLKSGLQETQELLARAYGYASLHELQAVLKIAGSSGPFEDFPLVLSPATSATPGTRADLRFQQDARLMREIDKWRWVKEDHSHYNRDALACDLCLFSSPAAHRAGSRSVWAFLESEVGYSTEGFPFGFRGTIHSRYLWRLTLAKDAFAELNEASDRYGFTDDVLHPQEQLNILRRYRAPQLFLAMVEETAPEVLADHEDDIQLDTEFLDGDELERLLMCDFDDLIAYHLDKQFGGANEEHTDEVRHRLLLEAIAEPSEERIRVCIAPNDVDKFRERVARWRMALRTQLARLEPEDIYGEPYDEFNGPPAVVTAGREDHILTLMLLPRYTGIHLEHWRICGTLMIQNLETEEWSVAGSLSGDFIHPAREGTYESPDSVVSYFDDQGNVELLRVWELLQSLYLNRADYVDYGDWVNDDFGVALANLRPWVAPKHRGTDALSWLFADFVEAFEESCGRTWDADWRGWIGPAVDDGEYYEDEPDVTFAPAGVVFIPMYDSGVLGYSVWDGDSESATGKLLMSDGERVVRTSRTRTYSRNGSEKSGIGWRLVNVVKETHADFVFYDPHLKTER
jgi:hypothetical protein